MFTMFTDIKSPVLCGVPRKLCIVYTMFTMFTFTFIGMFTNRGLPTSLFTRALSFVYTLFGFHTGQTGLCFFAPIRPDFQGFR